MRIKELKFKGLRINGEYGEAPRFIGKNTWRLLSCILR